MNAAGVRILIPGVPLFRQHVYADEARGYAIDAARSYGRPARIGPLPADFCPHCLERIGTCEGCEEPICECIDEERPRAADLCWRCTVRAMETS